MQFVIYRFFFEVLEVPVSCLSPSAVPRRCSVSSTLRLIAANGSLPP